MVGVELGQAAAEQRSHALLDALQAPSHVLTKNLSAVVRACLLPGRVADGLDLLGVAGRRIDRRQDRFLVPVAAEFFGWQARRASATATSPSSPTSTTSTIRHRAHGDLPPLPQGEEWLSEYDPTRGEWGWVSTMDFPEESLRRPAPTARREWRQPVNSVTHRPGRPSPGWLGRAQADALLTTLTATLAWEQKTITMYGKTTPVPRLTCWVG